MASPALLLLLCHCAPGERMLYNCTDSRSALCWPCDAGFSCQGGDPVPCTQGWSARGASACLPCGRSCADNRSMIALPCTPISDLVCVACPPGYECRDGLAAPCPMHTFGRDGACHPCPPNTTSSSSRRECVPIACAADEFPGHGGCQRCPSGFVCDPATGSAAECPVNTYSSPRGCVACDPNAEAPPRSAEPEACVCNPGYVKTAPLACTACKSGTVWHANGTCTLCDAGHYCVGRTHSDVCPIDMYSARGSAVCTECRPFSGCARPPCTDASNCTCDPGYVDRQGKACVRCAPGTWKPPHALECVACPPGQECLGGNDVLACGIGRFSRGNRSVCARCTECRALVSERCNATHDSVCARSEVPLAIVRMAQLFRTQASGELFAMFAMIFASSLPRTRLLNVCSQGVCVDCFQGACPVQRIKARIAPPQYALALEARFHAAKLHQNLEVLAETRFLRETAEAVMRKLTDVPFEMESKLEYEVICPDEGLVWDNGVCGGAKASQRTWIGLVVAIVLLGIVGAWGRSSSAMGGGWVKVSDSRSLYEEEDSSPPENKGT